MGVGGYLSLSGSGREVGWGGRLLTFSAFRMGAYSRLGLELQGFSKEIEGNALKTRLSIILWSNKLN